MICFGTKCEKQSTFTTGGSSGDGGLKKGHLSSLNKSDGWQLHLSFQFTQFGDLSVHHTHLLTLYQRCWFINHTIYVCVLKRRDEGWTLCLLLICCWPPQNGNWVSMETFSLFITPLFAFLLGPHWFLGYFYYFRRSPSTVLGFLCNLFETYNFIITHKSMAIYNNSNLEAALIFNLCVTLNNLVCLWAPPLVGGAVTAAHAPLIQQLTSNDCWGDAFWEILSFFCCLSLWPSHWRCSTTLSAAMCE